MPSDQRMKNARDFSLGSSRRGGLLAMHRDGFVPHHPGSPASTPTRPRAAPRSVSSGTASYPAERVSGWRLRMVGQVAGSDQRFQQHLRAVTDYLKFRELPQEVPAPPRSPRARAPHALHAPPPTSPSTCGSSSDLVSRSHAHTRVNARVYVSVRSCAHARTHARAHTHQVCRRIKGHYLHTWRNSPASFEARCFVRARLTGGAGLRVACVTVREN